MPASQPRVRDHTWTRGAGKRGSTAARSPGRQPARIFAEPALTTPAPATPSPSAAAAASFCSRTAARLMLSSSATAIKHSSCRESTAAARPVSATRKTGCGRSDMIHRFHAWTRRICPEAALADGFPRAGMCTARSAGLQSPEKRRRLNEVTMAGPTRRRGGRGRCSPPGACVRQPGTSQSDTRRGQCR